MRKKLLTYLKSNEYQYTELKNKDIVVKFKKGVKNMTLTSVNKDLQEFKKEMYEFKNEMYEFKKEMYEFRDEMYEFRKEMYEFKKEVMEMFKLLNNKLDIVINTMNKRFDRIETLPTIRKELKEQK